MKTLLKHMGPNTPTNTLIAALLVGTPVTLGVLYGINASMISGAALFLAFMGVKIYNIEY